ncbi:MAG: PRD domain-containing protein [Anaerostipes hadrus]
MNIEDLAEMLISKMQESLRIEFDQDGILIKGLLNHLGPMIDRIKEMYSYTMM